MSDNNDAETITVTDVTAGTEVADNPYALLMYYLNCIQSCSTLDFGKMVDYKHFSELTQPEKKDIIDICCLFTPRMMVKSGIFEQKEDIDCLNKFVEIKKGKTESVATDGNSEGKTYSYTITQTMYYKRVWIFLCYYNPMNQIKDIMPEIRYKKK